MIPVDFPELLEELLDEAWVVRIWVFRKEDLFLSITRGTDVWLTLEEIHDVVGRVEAYGFQFEGIASGDRSVHILFKKEIKEGGGGGRSVPKEELWQSA